MTMLFASLRYGFNGLELLCLGLALVGIGGFGQRLGWTWRGNSAALVLVAPVLFLTVVEATQFMTMDELGISGMILNPANRGASQISDGAFLTGMLVELPVTRILQSMGVDPTTIRMVLKAAWWLIGNGLVAGIAAAVLFLRSGGGARRNDPILFAGLFTSLALLPTTQLALKTVNYDLFSLGAGTLALLLLLRAARADSCAAWLALAFATLAAQEKLIAGPILVLSILFVAVRRLPEVAPLRSRMASAAGVSVLALCVSLAITTVSLAALRLAGVPLTTEQYWPLSLGPVSSWMWIPLGLWFPIATILHWRLWVGLVAIAVLVGFASIVGALLRNLLRVWRGVTSRSLRLVSGMVAAFTVSLLTVGVLGAELVQGYWAPFAPTPLRKLALGYALNGVVLHVGATTYATHLLGLTAYAIAVLVVAVPSAIWAAGLLGVTAPVLAVVRSDPFRVGIGGGLIAASIVLPISAALVDVPFAHRYFNISIALLASGLTSLALAVVDRPLQTQLQWPVFAAVALFILLCCWETFPFRPLHAAFRPFWLNYRDATRAQPGLLNASWMGWGEGVMLAGKQLEASCLVHDPGFAGVPCSDVTLYAMESGAWLPGPSVIHVKGYTTLNGPPPTSRNSFYVVNRLYLIQDIYPIPQIPADLIVSFRGYDLAWVYRGDRLAAAGYNFRRPNWRAAEKLATGKLKR